ncbi:MAG: UbiA family prenyltransferase [Desulfomonilia bacterium]|jgi:4-hydroxybenzoate polyprenyltransferase
MKNGHGGCRDERLLPSFLGSEHNLKTTLLSDQAGLSRLNLFLALSRTPHLLLDLATPGLAALLCLNTFPSFEVLALGLITAFSGYTAVYALNDLIDYRVDQEIMCSSTPSESRPDLDSVFVRHPLAQGMLSYKEALFWTSAWAVLALVGAFLLNPVCPVIFLSAAFLEVIYCYLLKITHMRSVISGLVKTSGPVAAVFAVNPNPSTHIVVTIFLWLFFWEIGGQNVPNDLSDLDIDRKIHARTIPVRFGAQRATHIIFFSLVITAAMSLAMFWLSPRHLNYLYILGALFSAFYLLLLPGYRLYRAEDSGEAVRLFNRASYYPLSMLMVTLLSWVVL